MFLYFLLIDFCVCSSQSEVYTMASMSSTTWSMVTNLVSKTCSLGVVECAQFCRKMDTCNLFRYDQTSQICTRGSLLVTMTYKLLLFYDIHAQGVTLQQYVADDALQVFMSSGLAGYNNLIIAFPFLFILRTV